MYAASYGVGVFVINAVISPASTSPVPPIVIPLFPVELSLKSSFVAIISTTPLRSIVISYSHDSFLTCSTFSSKSFGSFTSKNVSNSRTCGVIVIFSHLASSTSTTFSASASSTTGFCVD